jgi:cytochrome P450
MSNAPVSDIDLFSDEARLDLYPRYSALRQLGSVVHLPEYEVYALPRYQEVRDVLGDWELYSSAEGVTMNRELDRDLKGIMLFSDPPEHTAMRRVFGRPLRPDRMRELEPQIEAEAERVVETLVARGEFDAVTELAQHLPMTVVSWLVGLGDLGRSHMLRWARATWEAQGWPNERVAAAGPEIGEFVGFVMDDGLPGKLAPGGWAAELFAAADRGEIPREKCPFMLIDYVTPSLDTTISAVSSAVRLFADYPAQWDLLRKNAELVPHAINEVLRLESPVQQFTRTVTFDHALAGYDLPAGSRLMMLYGSANRDERKYPDPDRFDITRMPSDHLAFGRGEHACVGMQLARLEMSALLNALIPRVERFEVMDASPLLSNVLKGWSSLRVRVS